LTRLGRLVVTFAVTLAIVAIAVVTYNVAFAHRDAQAVSLDPHPKVKTEAQSGSTKPLTMRQRIVQIAESQLGYQTDPSNTYCNKYSASFFSGDDDCNNSNRDEEWCADFAAWVWQKAGALVNYQYINGDLNSSAASFYEWGAAHGTWHPVGAGYVPQPGDVAVFGLDTSTLVASHVGIVVSYHHGDKGPNVINGDGDKTGYSIVELETNEYKSDAPGHSAPLSGYTSPVPG
jgi:hypothetical protein